MTNKLSGAPVCVVGAGIMGAGIAQVAAQAGHAVLLHDTRDGAAAAAKVKLANTLQGLVAKGKLAADAADATLARITPIGAAEALAMGLVQQVASLEALDAAVDATLGALLAGGPGAQREIKALFAQLDVGPITAEKIELSAQTISRVRGTDEAREGFAAFLDKRPAAWIPQA